jgi:folate-binding protein YgfZ
MDNHFTALPHRAVIALHGKDIRDFLQGLITNDIRKATDAQAIYAALLTPQGKFLHDFFIIAQGEALLMDTDAAQAAELIRRLSMYKLRSDVTIENRADTLSVWALTERMDTANVAGGIVFPDPRHDMMGSRLIAPQAEAVAWLSQQNMQETDNSAYQLQRLTLGIPEGADDFIADKTFLLENGFEALHGVDFTKGCYVGQEVTARTKHRGQMRKFIHKITGNAPLPVARTAITANGLQVGEMRSSQGNIGLAMLRTEELMNAQANGATLETDGVAVTVQLPDWAGTI